MSNGCVLLGQRSAKCQGYRFGIFVSLRTITDAGGLGWTTRRFTYDAQKAKVPTELVEHKVPIEHEQGTTYAFVFECYEDASPVSTIRLSRCKLGSGVPTARSSSGVGVIKGDLPYSSNPTQGVERMLQGLAELGVPRPTMRRLEGVRPALVALLKKTSLDDLDGEVLLDWLIKEAGLHFVDDLVYLPAKARSELTWFIAGMVSRAVTEDVSIPAFAKKVVEELRNWAKRRSIEPKPLASYQEQLINEFGSVVWYRAPDAQAARSRSASKVV